MRLKLLALILILMFCLVYLTGCGKAPTGQTDYRNLKEEMKGGSNPPPPPPPDQKSRPPAQGG